MNGTLLALILVLVLAGVFVLYAGYETVINQYSVQPHSPTIQFDNIGNLTAEEAEEDSATHRSTPNDHKNLTGVANPEMEPISPPVDDVVLTRKDEESHPPHSVQPHSPTIQFDNIGNLTAEEAEEDSATHRSTPNDHKNLTGVANPEMEPISPPVDDVVLTRKDEESHPPHSVQPNSSTIQFDNIGNLTAEEAEEDSATHRSTPNDHKNLTVVANPEMEPISPPVDDVILTNVNDTKDVEYFKKLQYMSAEYDDDLELYVQDCNRLRADKNAVIVAFQERHYWFHYYYMQDMDDTKCARFSIFSGNISMNELPLIDVVSSETNWTKCPENAVMTGWYDNESAFSQPDKIKCSSLPGGFSIGGCSDIVIEPEEGSDYQYSRYISEYNQPADEKWPMECPQLPNPSAMVGFHYHHNDNGDPYWKSFKCCTIESM